MLRRLNNWLSICKHIFSLAKKNMKQPNILRNVSYDCSFAHLRISQLWFRFTKNSVSALRIYLIPIALETIVVWSSRSTIDIQLNNLWYVSTCNRVAKLKKLEYLGKSRKCDIWKYGFHQQIDLHSIILLVNWKHYIDLFKESIIYKT